MKRTRVICALCGFLLALLAGGGFYQILWKLYRNVVLDYGNAPHSVGTYESSFFYWLGGCGLLVTIGLTVSLAMLLPAGFRLPGKASLAMIPLAVALALAGKFVIFQQSPASDEENSYRFTAQTLAHGRLTMRSDLPPELLGRRWGWIQHGNEWAGICPIGWPMLLAIGYLLHLSWLMNPLLAGLALWLAAALARRAYGADTAALTLLLLGSAPFFLLTAATDVASPAAAVGVLVGALGVLAWQEERNARWLLICGTGSACALVCRPLTSTALLAPWWILLLWRERRPKMTILWLGPVAAAFLLLLALNSALTGDAFQTAEQAGLRSWGVNLDASLFGFGADYRTAGGPGVHTLTLGLLYDFVNLGRLNYWLLGWPLSLMLVWAAPWTPATKRLAAGVAALLLVATTSFYPGFSVTGPLGYFEAGCLLVILCAAAMDRLSRWYAGTAAAQIAPHGVAALATSILVVNVALFAPMQVRSLRAMSQGTSLLSRTLEGRVTGPAVIFVENVQPPMAPNDAMKSYVYFPPLNPSMDDAVVLLNSGGLVMDRVAWKKFLPNRRAYRYKVGPDWKAVMEALE